MALLSNLRSGAHIPSDKKLLHIDVLILHRDTAGQERYKVRLHSFVVSTKGH